LRHHPRNRRIRILRKWSRTVAALIVATQQFRQFTDSLIARRRRALLDGGDKARAGHVRDSIAQGVISVAKTFLASAKFLNLGESGKLGIDEFADALLVVLVRASLGSVF
jgi:hypothetical protein